MEQLITILKKLTETHGPSGWEDRVRAFLVDELQDCCDRLYVDKMGNLVAVLEGNNLNRKILVDAHMDEVGLIVKGIDNRGSIFFEKVGWIDDRVLPAREVVILTSKGEVSGVIGLKSRHLLTSEEISKPLSYREMKIDIGALSKDEALNMGVEAGCGVAFATSFKHKENQGIVSAKALDNRIGCTILIEAIRQLSKNFDYDFSLYFVGTVQEEIGAKGAATVAFDIKPNMAICLDTLPVDDVADKPTQTKLYAGPCIRIFDFHEATLMGTVSNRWLTEKMRKTAEKQGIPHQADIFTGTFLNSSTLHLTGSGIPTGAIVIPRRYAHSPCEVASISDIKNGLKLLTATIQSFADEDFSQCGEKKIK